MSLSSYLTRLIWLSILPVVAFSAWLSYDIVRKMQVESDERALYTARNFATAVDHHLNARIGSLKVMATSPLADDPFMWPIYYKVAQGYRENFGSHVVFAEADEPRQMLFNTRAPLGTALPHLPKPKGNTAVAQAIASGSPAVGDIFNGPIAGQKLVAIAVPVVRLDRTVKVLVATFELRHFQERLEQVALPAGWGLSLLDGQGESIARRQSFSDEPVGQDASYRRIEVKTTIAPWLVVLEIPQSIYWSPMKAAGIGLGVSLLAVALIAMGAGLWGSRRLRQAVASLADRKHGTTDSREEIVEIAAVRELIDADSKRIASFTATQNQAIEEERRRVAREVHDQLGQIFTALKMIVQSVPREAFPPGQESALNQALEMGIASARKITADLRPPLLDDLGLADALEHFGKEITLNSPVDFQVALADHGDLAREQALGLFRIVQEAVTNTLRHAECDRIVIAGHRQENNYHFKIEDNGKGFDPERVRQGAMGLINMQERAVILNGSCKIHSTPGTGTRIDIVLPLNKNTAPA